MRKFRFLLAVCALALGSSAFAQTEDFYAEIKQFMTDNRAEYDSILSNYFAAEEMSLDDYALLYYGYTYTDSYKPGYLDSKADSLISKKEYEKAFEHLLQENRKDPTSLKTLFDLMNLADLLNKTQESNRFQNAYLNLVRAILQSGGDGSSAENAIYVNSETDEFQLLSVYFKAVSIVSREFTEDFKDRITIKDSDGAQKVLYFDFSRFMEVAQAK